MNRVRRFENQNGIYVLGTASLEFFRSAFRNFLLSRKLRVKKIKIGPQAFLRGLSCIEMGEDFMAGPGLWLEAITKFNDQTFLPKIVIGNHVRISHNVHIAATHFVEIGDHVLMGSKVVITDHNHGQYSGDLQASPQTAPTLRRLDRDRRVVIGRNAWLGDSVVVTAGASIGEGAVIGANSVVIGNIPAFALAVGMPATVRKIFDADAAEWRPVHSTIVG